MKYVLYQDRKKEWRWRLTAANGRIIADSGEGYVHKTDCIDAIGIVKTSAGIPVILL